jgi:hypothetical protein
MNPNQKTILDELLSKSDLDTKVTLFIANKDKEGQDINKELINIMSKRILKKLSLMAGGANISKSKGAYYSVSDKLLMYEDNYIINCYMSLDTYNDNQINIYNMAIDNNNFLNQESTLILINDQPIFITDREEIKEEQQEEKEQELIINADNFNDFKNKFKDIIDNQEKQTETDLSFKKFYNYDNMIKYIETHLIYSTCPIFNLINDVYSKEDNVRYVDGKDLEYGDIIYIHGNSNYDYDRIFKYVSSTKHFIKYIEIIPHKILEYFNNDNWGSSRMTYKYNYNICQNQIYRRNIHNQFIKLNDNFKNTDFLYITNYLH